MICDWIKDLLNPEKHEPQPDPTPQQAEEPMRLSKHFTLAELTRSATANASGIDNSPGVRHLANLHHLAETLEHVRALLGNNPIIISSGYRSPDLNRLVGGSDTSSHSQGLAADFTCPRFGSVIEICEAIRDSNIQFDQLIYEQGSTEWVHLGIDPRMRRQVMSWSRRAGYVAGIRRL